MKINKTVLLRDHKRSRGSSRGGGYPLVLSKGTCQKEPEGTGLGVPPINRQTRVETLPSRNIRMVATIK